MSAWGYLVWRNYVWFSSYSTLPLTYLLYLTYSTCLLYLTCSTLLRSTLVLSTEYSLYSSPRDPTPLHPTPLPPFAVLYCKALSRLNLETLGREVQYKVRRYFFSLLAHDSGSIVKPAGYKEKDFALQRHN